MPIEQGLAAHRGRKSRSEDRGDSERVGDLPAAGDFSARIFIGCVAQDWKLERCRGEKPHTVSLGQVAAQDIRTFLIRKSAHPEAWIRRPDTGEPPSHCHKIIFLRVLTIIQDVAICVVAGIFSAIVARAILEKKIGNIMENIMENIKYAIRSSQILSEIKHVDVKYLSNVLAAAKQLGFLMESVDCVQIEKNIFDVWCDSKIQDRMEWRLTVTVTLN